MISKRKLERFINEEMSKISEKTDSMLEKGEFPKGEFEKFFLLMRMAIKFNLYSKDIFREIKNKMEEDIEKYGS